MQMGKQARLGGHWLQLESQMLDEGNITLCEGPWGILRSPASLGGQWREDVRTKR